jgi:UPF0755 protein
VWLVLVVGCLDPDAPVVPGDDTPFELTVPPGATASGLADELEDAGLVPAAWRWKLYLRQADGSCLKAGRFSVHRAMSLNELLATLCGPPLAEDVPFTVVEGWRIRDIDAALAANGWIAPGAFAAIAETKSVELPFVIEGPTLEGYLYPETYRVDADPFDPKDLITRQLTTFDARFRATHPDLGGRTLHEVVVMASMLEREEPNHEQRPLVAGILWKRIDSGTPLGVDATSRYTLEQWNDRGAFLDRLRDPGDPYNSRLRAGLPPTPIGNPTLASLEAAINPVSSEYWYYLHDSKQQLHPARNAAEHEANRKRYGVY